MTLKKLLQELKKKKLALIFIKFFNSHKKLTNKEKVNIYIYFLTKYLDFLRNKLIIDCAMSFFFF